MSELNLFKRMQPHWEELTRLINKARSGGVGSLTAPELEQLDRLYRLATVHLAQLQSGQADQALVYQLNRLVAQAHSLVYVSPRPNPLWEALKFYAVGFPRAFARTWRFHAVSLALVVIGSFAGYYASMDSPVAAYALLPITSMEVRLPGANAAQLMNVLEHGRDMGTGEKLRFASFLLQHNIKVGLTAFTAGVLGGIPTVLLMTYTGGFLGAFTAVHHQEGIIGPWWAWILPHGFTEIGAALMCGGAGLMLGKALLAPGFQSRRKSLTEAGKEGVRLALGVFPMFIAAGIIESFVRQSEWSTEARLWFAMGTLALWASYFGLGMVLERVERNRLAPDGRLTAEEIEAVRQQSPI